MNSWLVVLCIACGGALGAVSRYGLSNFAHYLLGDHFPFGTLAVNVLGCFLLGIAGGVAVSLMHPVLRSGATTGFLGALTTFSTFGLETIRHFEKGEYLHASGNVAANLFAGLVAVAAGLWIARMLSG